MGLILVAFVLFSACGVDKDEVTGSDSSIKFSDYQNEAYAFSISYPPTYTLKEEASQVIIYHFEDQPVPYFTIDIYDKPVDSVIEEIDVKILGDKETEKNDITARQITTFHEELGANIDTYYFSHDNKTYSFSCLNGLYDDVCSTFKFLN